MRVSSEQLAVSRKRRLVTNLFFTICLLLTVFLPAVSTEAQEPGKLYRIGILELASPSASMDGHNALRQGLYELGYTEGKTSSSNTAMPAAN